MADENQANAGNAAGQANGAGDGQNPEFGIQKIYLKDVSFESPNTPDVFREEWQPEIEVSLNNQTRKLGDNTYEIVLGVTATGKQNDKTAFLAEVQQAGLFVLRNFADEQLNAIIGSYCPSILFPYARQAISDMTAQGGFPSVMLNPVNFDAIYADQLQKRQQEAGGQGATAGDGDLTL